MPGWFDRRLDRELGPAADAGGSAARESWLRDWPLLLGLALSAVLIAGSLAVRGPHAKPTTAPPAAASAGSAIPGGVVDVGEGDAAAPATRGTGKRPEAAKAAPIKKKKSPKSSASSAGDSPAGSATATHGGGRAGGGASEGSNAGGGSGSSGSGGSSSGDSGGGSSGGGRSSSGRGVTTPGKIVNVTGTSATYTNGPFSYAFRAPTHTPTVGKRWVLSIGAKRFGKPLAGRVKIDILHQGSIVGHVANAPLSNGRFAHKFDWPARSIGHPLTVKATVVGGGFQQSFLFNVKVKAAG